MTKRAKIFWCTGLSGAGKSTLTAEARKYLESLGHKVLILDGDVVRGLYDKDPGFGKEAIEKNNLKVAELCNKNGMDYDVILVAIISPIDGVRKQIRKILNPNFHLIYLKADIESLKERDVKGLYAKAESGELTDLIGYSKTNPYEEPDDADLVIDTGRDSDLIRSTCVFNEFIETSIVCL